MIQRAWDDISVKELDASEVRKARRREIEYAEDKKVWIKVTRAEAEKRGWKIIKTRWIDINKGDEERPNYRSRLVGKEFKTNEGEGLFAATPPLEAMRMLISEAATIDEDTIKEGKVTKINDVARAFF